jgi:hypothetical protein
MVALQSNKIVAVDMEEALEMKLVDEDLYDIASIFFG